MAAIAFDPLEYARALESSGVSREQAEVHAKAMTQVFVHNMDALVTRDYLDTRFAEFATRLEARLEGKMERRFTTMDIRFTRVDARLEQIDSRFEQIDSRFEQIESRFEQIDSRFSQMDARFAAMDVRFARSNVMLGIILVAVTVPMLQTLIGY